ncbi:MAG: LacI family DNA-binding transcriptional regulator [Caldilineaceae bacterium]|nr:LacI family DNA-binding transcriptional regulator [Caldilineaceae bacterium]
MRQHVTIKDVAKHAGLSTATVTRVLQQRGYVAEETKDQVLAAIEETGYRVNTLARALRQQQTKTLGHLLHCISPNPFFARVALGAEKEAHRYGYNVLLYNVEGDPAEERRGVETLLDRRVDGIIFTTAVDPENVQLAVSNGVPVVQVERITHVETHAVLIDNYAGSSAAMEHLIELGHERIAYIGGDPHYYQKRGEPTSYRLIEEERLAGYVDVLNKYGLPVDKQLVALGEYYSMEDGGFAGDGALYTEEFLGVANPPTAIFATCDILAAGALQTLYRHGLGVPDDMSVVGFDGTYAPFLTPSLTTVQQPMLEIGGRAAQILIELQDAPESEEPAVQRREQLTTYLSVRSSTGPAPDR